MSHLVRPFSTPGQAGPTPLVEGRGSWVRDASGRTYLNAAGGLWNLSLGLGVGRVAEAIARQAETLAFAPLFDGSHGPAEQLATRLVALTEGTMRYAYLSTSGSLAVEIGLRAARTYHRLRGRSRKRCIVAFEGSYHGSSWIAMNASGVGRSELGIAEGLAPDFEIVASPADEARALGEIEALFLTRSEDIAAVIIEPIQGSGGVIVPSKAFGETLTTLCRRADVLLVADEVATGLGRCGVTLVSPVLGLSPDIIALAKGLGAGYLPISATLFSARVLDPLIQSRSMLNFGSTQDGNPIACAAALAALDVIEEANLLDHAQQVGAFIQERLNQARQGRGPVSAVRGMGLMIGVELAHEDGAGRRYDEAESLAVRWRCRDEGALVYHFAGGVSLFPPINMTFDEADQLVEILVDVFATVS